MTPAQREKHEQALYRHHEMITKATLDAISFSNEQNKLIAAKKRRGKSNDGYIPVTNVNGLNGIDPKGEKYYDTKAMPFNVVKITAIASCALLERLSEILSFIDVFPNSAQTQNLLSAPILVKSDEKVTRYIKERAPRTPAWNHKVDNPPKPLSTVEIEQLDRVIARLDSLCKKSEEVRITLLIDAEQTYYQPAIDLLYMMMCLRYNKKVPDAQVQVPTVYNTYQNYLESTLARLKHDLEFAQSNGCLNGSKLVRGAYLKVEKERAESHGSEYPLNGSLQETHDRYHAAVDFVLSNIDKMGVLIASHNQATDEYATSRIVNDFKLHRSDPRINFGQLYGMGDFLSLTLANAGFNIVKYVPCGPVMEILPYLSRRLTENSDILGGSKKETDRMLWEMKRRIGLAK
jgi:proline dehydrogenase